MMVRMQKSNDHWSQPYWPAHPRVRALMTSREGGVSQAPWDSMNLGDHVGDCPSDVQANRALLRERIGRRPVFLQQVHGVACLQVHQASPPAQVADACWTRDSAVACTIMVADCLPVLLCDKSGQWVAAAHAGWRGLAGQHGVGVLESLLADLSGACVPVSGVMAWLGPCIGPQVFEVGPKVKAAFDDGSKEIQALFKPIRDGKFLADLAGLARNRLLALGVTSVYGNDSTAPWCTVSGPQLFFSHRRDGGHLGRTGRMAACIWLD